MIPPIFRVSVTLAITMALSLPFATETRAVECSSLLEGVAAYDREVKRATRDEPEDLPMELGRHSRAIGSGDTTQAERIESKIRSGFVGLKAVDAPADVAVLHAGLIDYYGAAVAVLDARSEGEEKTSHAAQIETWLGLKRYFTNLRDLLIEHDCQPGDVEAINRDYLPRLERILKKIRAGEPAPDHY